MVLFNKINSRWCIAISLLIMILADGCIREELIDGNGSGNDLKISLSTRSVVGQSKEDKLYVSDIRILVIKGSTVVFNKSTKAGLTESGSTQEGTSLFILPLKQGNYKIAVVGNEIQAMTTQLDAVKTLSDLNAITVSDVFTEVDIPLYRELDVAVRHSASDPAKGEVQISGSAAWLPELEIALERIYTRVSLFVRKNTGNDKTIVIKQAELVKVPKFAYLSPRSFDHAEYQTIVPYNNAAGIMLDVNRTEDTDDNSSYTEVFSDENIFPENRMNNQSDAAKATALKLQGTYGGNSVNYQYNINFKNNFALLRNVHYKIYATIKTDGDIESQDFVVSPELWNGEKIDVDLLTPYLNVQELNLNLKLDAVADNHYHLHYWTNQDSTYVEPKMKRFDDATGEEEMDVSRVFNKLSGVGAENNHFDTKVPGSNGYTGYLEIEINPAYVFPHNTNQFRITLNANGLRREVTITIAKTASLNPTHIGYTPWIGTFHRWNQTGERVIAAKHSGQWSAKVMDDPSNSGNFVVITKSYSTDLALGTDDPDDAENHQVWKGSASNGDETLHDALTMTGISGTDDIYFRIGLKSKLFSPTAKPRYARVELTTQSGTYYLYVRQGEADDYVYESTEMLDFVANEKSTSVVAREPRDNARKISPYNLNVSRPTAGGTAFNSHYRFAADEKAVFVNYPTMVGWYFTWFFCGSTPYYDGIGANASLVQAEDPSYRKAYHPYNPAYHQDGVILNFPNFRDPRTNNKFSNYVVDPNNDPCPVGYEMVGYKEILHSLYRSYFQFTPANSQSYQFLVQDRNAINYLWGYYADGYYDRRPTRSLSKSSGDNYYRPFQIAGYNADVAYMGALFYNHDPAKNNSVFLPGGGIRTSTSAIDGYAGALDNVGGRALYFLKDNYPVPSAPHRHNGVGTIELGGEPGSNTEYASPTNTKYLFNFAFNGVGAHATPMRCVRKNYSTPEAAVVVFDWNGAVPTPLDAIVAGTVNNHYTTSSGNTINFVSGGNFMTFAGAAFSKDGQPVVFNGWNTKTNGSGTSYNTGSSMLLTPGVHILYAQWQ